MFVNTGLARPMSILDAVLSILTIAAIFLVVNLLTRRKASSLDNKNVSRVDKTKASRVDNFWIVNLDKNGAVKLDSERVKGLTRPLSRGFVVHFGTISQYKVMLSRGFVKYLDIWARQVLTFFGASSLDEGEASSLDKENPSRLTK